MGNGLAALLVAKRLVDVAPDMPEVNLRNPLHAGDEAYKQGIDPEFEPRLDVTRSSKLGNQWPHKIFSKKST